MKEIGSEGTRKEGLCFQGRKYLEELKKEGALVSSSLQGSLA